jgi:hypothetical protein
MVRARTRRTAATASDLERLKALLARGRARHLLEVLY